MNKWIIIIMLCLQGSILGISYAKDFPVRSYHCLVVKGNIQAQYINAKDSYTISDVTNKDLLKAYVTKGCLYIMNINRNNWLFKEKKITLTIHGGNLKKIQITKGAQLTIDKQNVQKAEYEIDFGSTLRMQLLQATHLDISVSHGSQGVIKQVKADSISVSASYGSHGTLTGSTRTLVVGGSNGSQINLQSLSAQDVTVNADKGAHITIYAIKKLKVKATSGANIDYKGSPMVRKKLTKGATLHSVSK